MTFPMNRVIAFAGPYISILGGAVATWLVAKMNLIGVTGLDQDDLAQQAAAALTFTLTAALTWLGQAQWLKGHHQQMADDAAVQAAALAVQHPPHVAVPPDPQHDALMALDEQLPDDDEEFASPPDQKARITPEPPETMPDPRFATPGPAPQFAEAPSFAAPPAPQFATPPPDPQFATPPPQFPQGQDLAFAPQAATAPPAPGPPPSPDFPA